MSLTTNEKACLYVLMFAPASAGSSPNFPLAANFVQYVEAAARNAYSTDNPGQAAVVALAFIRRHSLADFRRDPLGVRDAYIAAMNAAYDATPDPADWGPGFGLTVGYAPVANQAVNDAAGALGVNILEDDLVRLTGQLSARYPGHDVTAFPRTAEATAKWLAHELEKLA